MGHLEGAEGNETWYYGLWATMSLLGETQDMLSEDSDVSHGRQAAEQ